MIVLYIVPEGTNHHLEKYREESAPFSTGVPREWYLSEKALEIH